MLAAVQLVMLSCLNTDNNNNLGCSKQISERRGINLCVDIMNQQGTISDAETSSTQSWFLFSLDFWTHVVILMGFQIQVLISGNSSR